MPWSVSRPASRSRWAMVWWRPHSRAAFARLVGPPSIQWIRWWASHQAAGARQPGNVQWLVAEPQGSDLGFAEQSLFPALVQDLPGGAEHHGNDGCVARQSADGVAAEEHPVGHGAQYPGRAALRPERFEVQGEHHHRFGVAGGFTGAGVGGG